MLRRLGIVFVRAPQELVADVKNVQTPEWFPGASMNIAESCFTGRREDCAIIYADERGDWERAREAGLMLLQKPVPIATLLGHVHRALEERRVT